MSPGRLPSLKVNPHGTIQGPQGYALVNGQSAEVIAPSLNVYIAQCSRLRNVVKRLLYRRKGILARAILRRPGENADILTIVTEFEGAATISPDAQKRSCQSFA